MIFHGSDLFQALKSDNGEDVWYVVDEFFSAANQDNPYACPITAEMEINASHFKAIVNVVSEVTEATQALALPESQSHNAIQPLQSTELALAISQVLQVTHDEIQAYVAQNALALGVAASDTYGEVLEKVLTQGIACRTNTVLKRLSASLNQISSDSQVKENFLQKYGVTGSKVEQTSILQSALIKSLIKKIS